MTPPPAMALTGPAHGASPAAGALAAASLGRALSGEAGKPRAVRLVRDGDSGGRAAAVFGDDQVCLSGAWVLVRAGRRGPVESLPLFGG